ncbi:FtsQ-type POTRA domain-containing protein [Fodinisporobacter ferrooxydans]|uniref:FtsQ-type POTRA domain-containing protein n=1 Tax=Fodinisporobacter ferrooxydans TaxID=2901836 RepID=A0ABY4CFV1_9BACL|nr:FtsQ-type POTRA domain-containing protein [Alicyclobacillaceae bacterium MYW30-H2]
MQLHSQIGSYQQPKKQPNRPNRKALIFVVLFFICAAAAIFVESPLSKVRTIQVIGAKQVPADQILQWSQVQKGESIWKVHAAEIQAQIKKHLPLIQRVDVATHYLTGRVDIAVAEKSIAAVYISNAKMYQILNDGTVFAEIPLGSAADKPIISEDKMEQVKVGQKLANSQLAVICSQVGNVAPFVSEQISEIHVNADNTWTVFMKDGNEIELPSGTLETNMKLYPDIQKSIADKKLPPGMIHVYAGKLVYSPFQTNGKGN